MQIKSKKIVMTENKKNVLLVCDMPGYGKVATAVMIPILSYMGHPTYNIPTMLISNTFEYGRFEQLETTDYIVGTMKTWKKLGFKFDAVATGYMPSERQAEVVSQFCREQAKKGALVFVDPVMGDEGQLYNGVGKAAVKAMREMVSVADVTYPNHTEACLLTDQPYHAEGVSRDEAKALIDGVREIGAKSVVITSILVEGRPSVVGYSHMNSTYFELPFSEIPVHFPGTGDIFSAVLIGHMLDGLTLAQSTQKAMDSVYNLIDKNRGNEDKNCGIPIERDLGEIV